MAAALAVLLTGCGRSLPKAREMDDMALMRAMGVDAAVGPGQVEVTLSSSRRARGIQGEEEPPLVLSAKQPSVRRAMLAMQGLSDSYVFCGHVDQLLLGEEVARRGVGEALGYFARDRQLGLGAQVWLIRGAKASDAIGTGKEKGVDTRLSTLQNDGEIGTAGLTRTVGETLTALLEDGSAYLPALELSGEEEGSAALLERGYAVLKGRLWRASSPGTRPKVWSWPRGGPRPICWNWTARRCGCGSRH